MATVGFATLDVIPSLRGLQGELNRQSRGPMAAAGRAGGRLYGEVAGQSAGSNFVNLFQREATDSSTLTRAGTTGGRVFGQSAAREAGQNFTTIFQSRIAAPIASAGQAGGYTYGVAAGDEASTAFAGQFQQGLEGADLLAGAGIADIFQDAAEEGAEAGEETAKGFADGFGSLQGLLAGAGVVTVFKDLVDAGSAAEQSVGGVRAVFGEFAAQVEADSARAAQALGLSSTAYQELITVTGALLKNKGLTDYADQADTLVRTGADLAATFGGPTTQAVEALNAALRGESDPIERYAISLNETAVNARIAAAGQSNLTGAALDQAKVTARLAIIQEQSADAMGAFNREADTQAGQAARSTAAFADLRAELGEKLLPAATAGTALFNEQVIPALSGAASFATEAATEFRGLPQPVQTAALAFVALRAAAVVGIGSLATGAVATLASAFVGLRIRVLLASDAFAAARTNGTLLGGAFAAIQAGAAGAAGALRAVGGALAPIAAITIGISLFSKYRQEQEATKARVDELTASLDQQTGAITEATAAAAFDALRDSGAIESAQDLGVELGLLRQAALGDEDAAARLGSELDRLAASLAGASPDDLTDQQSILAINVDRVRDAIREQSGEVAQSRAEWQAQTEFVNGAADAASGAADATGDAATNLRSYAEEIEGARDAVKKLILEEKTRREALLLDRQDQLALEEQIRNARKQAREGADDGLNIRTAAGGENRGALYDLADQFNNSVPSVRNAEGAYERIRDTFIELAQDMGAGERQAIRLAEELLRVPREAPVKFQSEGYKQLMAEIEAARRKLIEMREVAIQRIALAPLPELGGLEPGRGGTSPNGAPSPRRGGTATQERPPAVDLGAGGLNAGGSTYNVYGDINVSDDEAAQRRMRRLGQRANGDGARRR